MRLGKALIWLTLIVGLSTAAQRAPFRIYGAGGGSGGALSASNLAYIGSFKLPDTGGGMAGQIFQTITGRRVGGVLHLLMNTSQNVAATYWGNWSPFEFTPPAQNTWSTTWQSAGVASWVAAWGISNSAPYDTYHGNLGATYITGSLAHFDDANNPVYLTAMAWHDVTATCCLYVSYSLPYGNYVANWHLLAIELTTAGTGGFGVQTGLSTTSSGPLRVESGVMPYGSCEAQGPLRTQSIFDLPDGTMGIGGSTKFTQQNYMNKGPAVFGGAAWPIPSTTAGYGSSRGSCAGRTTDILFPDDYLGLYPITGYTISGTVSTPIYAFRRLPIGGNPPYYYEGYDSHLQDGSTVASYQDELDPNNNGGNGSFTSNDGSSAAAWIDLPNSQTFVQMMGHATGHTWYKTQASQYATFPVSPFTVLFARDATEAWNAAPQNCTSCPTPNNKSVRYDVQAAHYSSQSSGDISALITVEYVNDGASQALTTTVSGGNITVHMATNGGGTVTSTANDVVASVNGAASALVTASLYQDGAIGNDGTGVVGVLTHSYLGAELSASTHKLWLAQGPQNCPRHNVDSGVTVTGPQSSSAAVALVMYRGSDLVAVKNSGGVLDYVTDPANTVYPQTDLSPSPVFYSTNNAPRSGGFYYDPADKYIYLVASDLDNITNGAAARQPVIHVIQVTDNASAPAPEPILPPVFAFFGLLAGVIFHELSK